MLEAGSKRAGGTFLTIRRRLRRLVSDADALLLAADTDASGLASLGPLQGLQQLRRGETFARRYGLHSPHLFEISYLRPARTRAGSTSSSPRWIRVSVDVTRPARAPAERTAAAWDRFRLR